MIVLAHEPVRSSAPITSDMLANARAARESGIRVHGLPIDLSGEIDNALGWLSFDTPTLAVLSTYIQRPKTYDPLYAACLERNIHLIHSPEQNNRIMEFSSFYSLICDLTAKSVVVTDSESLQIAQETLIFPVFTKGQIKSVKEQGWDACIANTPADLALRHSKWGAVIAREIMPLRKHTGAHGAFPEGREYRAFWLAGKIIGMEYYWNSVGRLAVDPLGALTAMEKIEVEQLIHTAANRVECPFVTVDVCQLEDLSWKIVELGDPQYSGICHMPRHLMWERVQDYAATWQPAVVAR
jgi:hypothetical protein